MRYDVIVVGGGLAGLTAGSLLAKRNLKVALIDKNYNPGGSCGIFKRGRHIFDQGSAMLYGFGETGFNAHRFVFNCLEEPIDMIKHDLLYCVNFEGKRIRFWPSVERFIQELSEVFPLEKEGIARFYRDMLKMYQHVMIETPSYSTPDEVNKQIALKSVFRHPLSYLRFLGYLNKSAKSLLEKYFHTKQIFNFFDKLTSTYCYSTVEESPAVLASVMFVDNHVGGSYYPAGSTLFLPGKLEKVIEENNGDMYLEKEVVKIVFTNNKPSGVLLDNGDILEADHIIYSGTVWNLYEKLLDKEYTTEKRRMWAEKLVPTYPSVVLYTVVDKNVIPEGTASIEMLVGTVDQLDESEVTAYIFSVDDRTLCDEDEHIVIAIGPTFEKWDSLDKITYVRKKQKEKERLISVLEKRFSGFSQGIRYAEVATPKTIERYTLKNNGAVAGPKQMLGQHMFKRLHTKSEWNNLYYCGESTVMGTGTPTVTTSGISAANAVLKKYKKEPYLYQKNQENFVRIIDKPVTKDKLFTQYPKETQEIMCEAMRCRYCEHPSCTKKELTDIRGIMRRISVGNFVGAKKCWEKAPATIDQLEQYEKNCICNHQNELAVAIRKVIQFLGGVKV